VTDRVPSLTKYEESLRDGCVSCQILFMGCKVQKFEIMGIS